MNLTYDVTMFRDNFESGFTWINGFNRNVFRFSERNALTDPLREKTWTYADLNKEINRLANRWQRDGVIKNDVVMYVLYNSAEFVFSHIAAQKAGAISCPVNYNWAAGEIAMVLEQNKPKVFLFDMEIEQIIKMALDLSFHKPEICISVGEKESEISGVIAYEKYVADSPEEEPVPPPSHIYDEVLRLHTSGTTGHPKGVPVNNINEVLTAHDVIMHFPLNPMDKTMNMTPWFHRGGIHSGGLTPTLYVGGEVVILRQFNPKICLKYTQKYRITFLIGVPAVLNMLAKYQEKENLDLQSLHGIVTMGSPLEKNACIYFQKVLTPNLFNGYGTTETFWNSFLSPRDLPEMSGSSGRSCTDDEIYLVKVYEDRKAEPDDFVARNGEEVGEIIIKSLSKSTCSYYDNEEETKRRYYKGFLYTGDLGTWDKNSYITVVGRKDDMIISAGENIFPAQIEEAISENSKVKDVIVTSVPDKKRGEAVVAYVVKEDDDLTVQEMIRYCAGHPMLSAFKSPKYYRFVEELPYNATGKKLHFKAKQAAVQDLEEGRLERY
ncbi:class I adenylate-forming enzyme family protein [Parasporobacterium paucivorans]|uniref:Acyl-CoA synthetase (AMP-forming)/AMP-acid ligase II n=1 Tax=Parasporobacterium paucivorans DSM 15970 TaxID=1122934 RepID=A0A1M6KCY1_9FIRM|nr:AMP-binding protein [Parasporobacterium paucivorans]SHJ56816.1 Acyl-CoA synthetase (AMP-forming)/AMP-acid ligase II [Parasporobacterium paucivorans DSM 15970]